MSRFLNARYEALEPYTPGEQPKNAGDLIKLNTNENPYPPAPAVAAVIDNGQLQKLKLYSDPEAAPLTEAIADFYGLHKEQVIAGNGSDEILAFIFMALSGKSGKVYYPQISYSFYPVYCGIFGAKGVAVPLGADFTVEPADYYHQDGTIVITNPNAPTGRALSRAEIESILKANRENLVVIDEAYVDFGAESAVKLIDRYDNLLVVQTFSKSRSLAGARIGYALGNEAVIADLNKIKFSFNPYNLNRLSILAGVEAIKDRAYFEETCGKIIKTREAFIKEMTKLGFHVLPSKANFVFASSERIYGEAYFAALRKFNILVRHFNDEKIANYVRITIGTPEEMDRLIAATKQILDGVAQDGKDR